MAEDPKASAVGEKNNNNHENRYSSLHPSYPSCSPMSPISPMLPISGTCHSIGTAAVGLALVFHWAHVISEVHF
jgi:hypothetical protein